MKESCQNFRRDLLVNFDMRDEEGDLRDRGGSKTEGLLPWRGRASV